MRISLWVPCLLAVTATSLLVPAAVPTAAAAANHLVISEVASRGPAGATDEFVELYNPTASSIDMSGWKLQYKSQTGASFADYTTLPAGATVAPHGFYLITNTTYVGSTPADRQWGSTGISDEGHVRILNAVAAEIDRVGWGLANAPEGGTAAPRPLATASIERKATAGSTAATLWTGGAEQFAGNGQDTDVNGSDFVLQSSGRNPQNTSNPPEPSFATGGSGTGRGRATPTPVYASFAVPSLAIAIAQDSAYTLASASIVVPSSWTWSHTLGDVALSGSAFAGAAASIVNDTIFVTGAAITTADSGLVTISNLTSPASNGTTTFTLSTAVAAGVLAQVVKQPQVRVLKLVPILSVHVNDASGVAAAPYGVGSEATVTGTVTVNWSATNTDIYIQDGTGGVDLFQFGAPPVALSAGDSVIVTGSIVQFRGLAEIQPDFSLLQVLATGRSIPSPLLVNCATVNATFHPDFTEPNEGRLVRVNGVSYNSVNSTITDASGTTGVFIPATYPPTPAVFDIIGILKQFKPGTPAPGAPYTADYEISPRSPDDIIGHPGPIILTTPYEDNIQATSVQLHWTTNVSSTSIAHFGLTSALGDSAVDVSPVTTHGLTVTGLTPATVYYYSVGSEDANGRNFTPTALFSTASAPPATGQVNVYFNKSIDASLQTVHPANGNANLTSLLLARLNAAQRSIDAAFYNLSGTPGATLASALVAAKNRGVKVRVIGEQDNRSNAPFNTIAGASIPLISDTFDPINNGNGLMHDKFVVIDNRGGAPDSQWVWTGSWNPTDSGTNDDYQNSIELQDPALANVYTMEFNEMWGSSTDTPNAPASRFGQRKLDDTPHKFVIGGRNVESYFSPSDATTSHILSTLNAAQHSIGFELLTVTRTDISAALIAQKNAGVAVRGDIDSGSDTGSQYSALVTAGVDVKLKIGSGLLHHKYLITDAENSSSDPTTLTGSHNWSGSAETTNNENTVIIHDADVTNQYLQEFAARYHQFGGTDIINVVSVDPIAGIPAGRLFLAQNAPNPAVGRTRFQYAIPTKGKVVLSLFDLAGRQVRTLVDQVMPAGSYQVDFRPGSLASGVYFYRLEAGGQSVQRKMLFVK